MPELPEVETIARSLRPDLLEQTILSADLRWDRTLALPSPDEFRRQVKGQQIQAVSRRAKYLILELSAGTMLVHLRMSGDLYVRSEDYQPEKHDRLQLHLSDAKTLVFNDTRKFGRVWLTDDPQAILAGLGPEPLGPDFTPEWLYQNLQARSRQLKPLLLDQSFLAGLGNIYTDEALHLSGLHPLRRSDKINREEAARLHDAIRQVLMDGIKHNGSSIDWVYRGGEFQNYFRAYDRTGQPCPVCGTPIQRLVVGQRGTHICPTCQPLE
jgi:formamidopyrimidine-DNA glycosylase